MTGEAACLECGPSPRRTAVPPTDAAMAARECHRRERVTACRAPGRPEHGKVYRAQGTMGERLLPRPQETTCFGPTPA